jgi:signal transduction histidine kinase
MNDILGDHWLEGDVGRSALDLAAALGEVGRSVGATLDLRAILGRIFDLLKHFIPYDSAAIMLMHDGALVVAAARGFPAGLPMDDVVLPYHAGTTHYPVVAEGRTLVLDDAQADPGWQVVPGYNMIHAWIGVPLSVEGRLIGMLTIDKWQPGVYNSQHAVVAQAFASQVAIAIRNAQLYEESQRAYAELQRAQTTQMHNERLRALGELASGIAHDFNNILLGILGNVQLLMEELSDPAVRGPLEVIERAVLDGAATVRYLQDFSRSGPPGPLAPCDLRDVAEGALALTRPRWVRRPDIQVALALEPALTTPAEVATLRQVLTNLLLNALDAMPEGGVLRVETGVREQEAFALVQDTGVGIPADLQARIFEPFVTTKGPAGSGMGLAMSRMLIARQGGRITVESAPGAGSSFTIWLPRGDDRPTNF